MQFLKQKGAEESELLSQWVRSVALGLSYSIQRLDRTRQDQYGEDEFVENSDFLYLLTFKF